MIWLIGEKKDDFNGLMDELSSSSYKYKWFEKISDTFNMLNHDLAEGIVIDADHSEISCFEFCHRIKSTGNLRKTRLIVISANPEESMEISAFKAGADEFVAKPLRRKAFIKRLFARLNNFLPEVSVLYKVSGKTVLKIDKESYSVYLDQTHIPLSRKEFEILHLIASYPGKVFTRDEIFKKVWKRAHDAKERTIDVHILRLRKKIGEEYISTQKGIGYRFCA